MNLQRSILRPGAMGGPACAIPPTVAMPVALRAPRETHQERVWRLAVEDLRKAQAEARAEHAARCIHPSVCRHKDCDYSAKTPIPIVCNWRCPVCGRMNRPAV